MKKKKMNFVEIIKEFPLSKQYLKAKEDYMDGVSDSKEWANGWEEYKKENNIEEIQNK